MENKQIIQQMLALLKQLDYKETSKDESLMKNLVEMSCDRYWLYNPITKVMQITITNNKDKENATRTRLLTDLLKHVSSDDQAKINKVFYNLEKQKTTEEDFEYCSDNGNVAIAYEVVTRSFIVDDELRIIGITRILGEAQKTIDYIIQAQKKFDLLMGLSSMYIWEYDILNKQFCANESLSNKLGIEERVYSLKELLEHIKIQELALFKEQIQKQKPMDNSVLHINILKNSYESIFETNYRPILNKHGDYVMLLGTLNDITEKELLKTMASKDKLTGCYNRSMADVKLETTFTSFKENDDFYTVIFFDIDKFKQIND
ncbi:MAG: diguanylate cyclase, partial [Longicatena sp.]